MAFLPKKNNQTFSNSISTKKKFWAFFGYITILVNIRKHPTACKRLGKRAQGRLEWGVLNGGGEGIYSEMKEPANS